MSHAGMPKLFQVKRPLKTNITLRRRATNAKDFFDPVRKLTKGNIVKILSIEGEFAEVLFCDTSMVEITGFMPRKYLVPVDAPEVQMSQQPVDALQGMTKVMLKCIFLGNKPSDIRAGHSFYQGKLLAANVSDVFSPNCALCVTVWHFTPVQQCKIIFWGWLFRVHCIFCA